MLCISGVVALEAACKMASEEPSRISLESSLSIVIGFDLMPISASFCLTACDRMGRYLSICGSSDCRLLTVALFCAICALFRAICALFCAICEFRLCKLLGPGAAGAAGADPASPVSPLSPPVLLVGTLSAAETLQVTIV